MKYTKESAESRLTRAGCTRSREGQLEYLVVKVPIGIKLLGAADYLWREHKIRTLFVSVHGGVA